MDAFIELSFPETFLLLEIFRFFDESGACICTTDFLTEESNIFVVLRILEGEIFLSLTPFILVELTDDSLAGVDVFPAHRGFLKNKIKSYHKM